MMTKEEKQEIKNCSDLKAGELIYVFSREGKLEQLQYLLTIKELDDTSLGLSVQEDLLKEAASYGQLHIVKFLMKNLEENKKILHQDDINKIIAEACRNNRLKVVNWLLKNKASNPIEAIKEGFFLAGLKDHVVMLKYLKNYLNIEELKEVLGKTLIEATVTSSLETVKWILTERTCKSLITIHEKDDYMIRMCFSGEKSLDFVTFLLTSPDIKEHANIHANNDEYFKNICFQKNKYINKEIIHFLIFDYNINKTDEIKSCLDNYPDIKELFTKRELMKKLGNELQEKKPNIRTPKI